MTGTNKQQGEQLDLALKIRDRCVALQKSGQEVSIIAGESLTEGAIMSALISAPGASEYILGGIVFYHVDFKQRFGLEDEMEPISGDFAEGAAQSLLSYSNEELGAKATLAITSTGYAGPTGKEGLYFLGLATKHDATHHTYEIKAEGSDLERRAFIRAHAVIEALKLVLEALPPLTSA